MKAVQDWLSGRADTRLGRLALQWFRAYFEASHNSGCAATVYSTLSVLPAALVAVAYFHSSGSDTNAFVERLVTHLKLNGATASLVQDTFGSASSNALAATITVVISFLIWGIGIGQIYQDVYARAWGIEVGSAADQGLFAIFFFVLTGAIALAVVSAGELRNTGWFVLLPVWLVGRRSSGSGCRASSCTERSVCAPCYPARCSPPLSSAAQPPPRRFSWRLR